MMRLLFFSFLVLILLPGVLLAEPMIVSSEADSTTIYVDVANLGDPQENGSFEHPFDAIQEGVDAASPGNTIHVEAGVYREHVRIAKSSISVVAENGTVIDGGGTRIGIYIGVPPPNYAENVTISGFTVENCVQGIVLMRCLYACFRNVSMVKNSYHFADYSRQVNDVDVSNTVDKRPIYYLVDQHDKYVPSDAGCVILMNCTNIIVRSLNLTKNGQAIELKYTSNSTIQDVNISDNKEGVYMDAWSSNNTIMGCTVTNNLLLGIYISASWGNVVTNNKVSRNRYGIYLDEASNSNAIENNTLEGNENGLYFYGESGNVQGNIVRANTVSNSSGGISLLFSRENIIYHNNFVNNVDQVYTSDSVDTWDRDGEGNYWSDYVGEDFDGDGVGDTQHVIDEYNQDNYPLMGLFSFFGVSWGEETYHLSATCSHSILDFRFIQPEKMISLDLTNSENASGFFKISLPTVLLGGPYTVLVDDSPSTSVNQTSNATHAFFYFRYPQGVRNIKIKGTTVIPEFSSLSLLLFFAVLVATILIQRTRLLKRQSVYA